MLFLRLLAFAIGTWLSQEYVDEYWVVGPVFGCVVCLWSCTSLRDAKDLKKPLFILASTLIYALVYHISRMDWDTGTALAEMLVGSMPVAVLVGSVLLPFAHKTILGKVPAGWRTAPLLLAASFYLISFVATAADHFDLGGHIRFISIAVVLWQAIYLNAFFRRGKSF